MNYLGSLKSQIYTLKKLYNIARYKLQKNNFVQKPSKRY